MPLPKKLSPAKLSKLTVKDLLSTGVSAEEAKSWIESNKFKKPPKKVSPQHQRVSFINIILFAKRVLVVFLCVAER